MTEMKQRRTSGGTSARARMARSLAVFFSGTVLSKLMVFLLIPLYTRRIAPAEYGYYDLSLTYVAIATSVVFFDVWVGTMRYMYDNGAPDWKQRVAANGLVVFAVSSAIFASAAGIAGLMGVRYWLAMALLGLTSNTVSMCGYIARGFGSDVHFAASGVLNTAVVLAASFYLVLARDMGTPAIYASGILGNLVQVGYLLLCVRLLRGLVRTARVDRDLTRRIMRYSLPMSVSSVSYWLMTGYSRIVVAEMLSLEANGIFAVASKFAAVVTLLAGVFTLAWQDVSFSVAAAEGRSTFFSHASRVYVMVLGGGLVIALPAISIAFPFLVGNSYSAARSVIPLFVLNAVVIAYSTYLANIFFAIKDTRTASWSTLVGAGVALCLVRPFTSEWSLSGAVIAGTLAFGVVILTRQVVLFKREAVEFGWSTFALVVVLVGVGMTVYALEKPLWDVVWLFMACALIPLVFRHDLRLILGGLKGIRASDAATAGRSEG